MKTFLVLYILLQGEPEAFQEAREVPNPKACSVELFKMMAQPLPKNVSAIQYSCVVKFGDDA